MTPYRDYVLLACELAVAVARHGEKSRESEDVRVRMDAAWFKLTEKEIRHVKKFNKTLGDFLHTDPNDA